MANAPDFSLQGRWEVTSPQPPLTIPREPLILALQYAIHARWTQELTHGPERETDTLKEWRRMLAIVERDEQVTIR